MSQLVKCPTDLPLLNWNTAWWNSVKFSELIFDELFLFFNKVGGEYSSSQTSQRYIDSDTRQIELVDDTIFAEPSQIYQIRYPGKDINIRVKNLKTVNFS